MDYKPTILSGGESRSDDQIIAAYAGAAAGGAATKEDESPLVVMELMQRLRVKDVMRRENIHSVVRTDSMRFAQNLMKRNKISGVPVVEDKRLFGVVSMSDIITALEGEWIHDPVAKHMATNLVVLEEDMPLAFAIKYFQNYSFGRFPVLDKNRDFVGLITQRDLTKMLMKRLSQAVMILEGRCAEEGKKKEEGSLPYYSMRQFLVAHNDLTNAGKAANEIKKIMAETGIDKKIARRIAVAAYELEINICIHSVGGTLTFVLEEKKAVIIAKDSGPGIEDVEWACRDGTSTANDWIRSMGFGAGMGLSNSKRMADGFSIHSKVPSGTTVICEFALPARG